MKIFEVVFNKTNEYGDMYEETRESILLAENIEDIITYLMKTYMPDATREDNEEFITLSRDVDGYPAYFIHDILVHEVKEFPLTDKISYLR